MELKVHSPLIDAVIESVDGSDCSKLSDVQGLLQNEIDACTHQVSYINSHHSGDKYYSLLKLHAQKEKEVFQYMKSLVLARKSALGC